MGRFVRTAGGGGRRYTLVACHSICKEFEDAESIYGSVVAACGPGDAGDGGCGDSVGLDVVGKAGRQCSPVQ